MADKNKYSEKELKEFEKIIIDKLDKANVELDILKGSLTHKNDESTDSTFGSVKTLEDGADTAEKEHLNQLAARQQKFIINLDNALVRIKTGSYGVCIETGKLISKARLRAVPHTQHSIEAKLNK